MRKRRILCAVLALLLFVTSVPVMRAEAASGSKLIALTFDDGPSAYTSSLLDACQRYDAHVTFFMTGQNGACGVSNYKSLLERMVDEGHQLANHTWSHPNLTNLTADAIRYQINSVNSYLYEAMGGTYQTFVRTPGGSSNDLVKSTIQAPLIYWSVDTQDWKYRDSSYVYNYIMNHAYDGAIILLHDIHKTSVEAAIPAIRDLKAKGYELVTVAELLRRRQVTPQNGVWYYSATNQGTTLPAYQEPEITIKQKSDSNIVKLSTDDTGVSLYYTTNGARPNLSSKKYDGAFEAYGGTTITVIGIDKYGTRTEPVSETVLFRDVEEPAYYYYGPVYWAAKKGITYGRATTNYTTFDPEATCTRREIVTFLWRLAGCPEPSSMESPFKDVTDTEAYYYKAVLWAAEKGITYGRAATNYTTFDPKATCTRREIVTFLWRYAGRPNPTSAESGFTDVADADAYYYKAVLWAVEKGITTGKGSTNYTTFDPSGRCTRAMAVTFLYRYAR